MPRKGPAPKRPVIIDPVYSSPLVTSLVNKVLTDGKRSVAERIVYGALEGCRDKTGTDPVITLKRAMDNVKPALEVRSRRVGDQRPTRRGALARHVSSSPSSRRTGCEPACGCGRPGCPASRG